MELIGPFDPWIKPTRKGVYKITNPFSFNKLSVYSYWSGRYWGLEDFTVHGAYQHGHVEGLHQEKYWCGLTAANFIA